MLEYETLKLIWLILIGVLFIGFAVTGGFDLGVATLLPLIGKNDEERRVLLNCIGPTWEGNQVWLVTAGGALFAAWPFMYAAAFSSLYLAFLIVLLSLILRPPGFDYRSKIQCPIWRRTWDYSLCLSGMIPSLVFGIAFGNLFLGIAFHYSDELRAIPTGHFLNLFTPYTLLTGVVSLLLLVTHGAFFLELKTITPLRTRAAKIALWSGFFFILTFSLTWFITVYYLKGFQVTNMPDPNTSFIPTLKTVVVETGLWLFNYQQNPIGLVAPLLSVFFMVFALLASFKRFSLTALVLSGFSIASVISTIGFTLFPFVFPSSTQPNHSLTIWDAASSQLTLTWMLVATVFFLPIVLSYTTWVYRVMRGKVRTSDIQNNVQSY